MTYKIDLLGEKYRLGSEGLESGRGSYLNGSSGVGRGYAIPLELNLPYEGLEAKNNRTKL